jgi:hypothetical protein
MTTHKRREPGIMRAMRSARVLLAVVVLALFAPTAAFAQGAFDPLPAATPAPEPVVTVPATSDPSGGLSGALQFLLFGVGVVIIGGIGFVIWRDARRNAPDTSEATVADDSRASHHATKKRNRARAKRARQARRRNR